MTLNEKLNKLPSSIKYNECTYVLGFGGEQEFIFMKYFDVNCFGDYHNIVYVENSDLNTPLSQRLEDIVDRVLTIIETEKWKK